MKKFVPRTDFFHKVRPEREVNYSHSIVPASPAEREARGLTRNHAQLYIFIIVFTRINGFY